MTINEDGTYTLTKDEIDKIIYAYNQKVKDDFLAEVKQLPVGKLCRCPTCDLNVGTYKRTLNAGQIAFIYELRQQYEITGELWHKYDTIQNLVKEYHHKTCTDYSKLTCESWGFIAPKSELKEDGNSSGYFCIRKRGAKFLDGKLKVPKWLLQTSSGLTLEESTELVGFNDFHEAFNLNKLIGKEV